MSTSLDGLSTKQHNRIDHQVENFMCDASRYSSIEISVLIFKHDFNAEVKPLFEYLAP